MAREINPVCDFFFGFMHTNLPTDTVDVELTIRMVQGIYIYHKNHMAKSTIFTLWSKSVTPFPSLRKRIKAFKEDSRGQSTSNWMPLVSTPIKPPRNPKRHALGKTRTRWSNHNHHFNPIKTDQVNMLGTDLADANKIEIIIKCTPKRHVSDLEPHAHSVDSRFHILCWTSQIGQARTGMEIRPKPGSKPHC